MALERTIRFGKTKKGSIHPNAGRLRQAMPFVRNEPGFRFIRDEQKSGIASKRVPR